MKHIEYSNNFRIMSVSLKKVSAAMMIVENNKYAPSKTHIVWYIKI